MQLPLPQGAVPLPNPLFLRLKPRAGSPEHKPWPLPFLSPASPRPSSVAAVTISGPCWTTTSRRMRGWRPRVASQLSPCTASHPTSSPTCSTTYTVITRRCGLQAAARTGRAWGWGRDRTVTTGLKGRAQVLRSPVALWGEFSMRLEKECGTHLEFSSRQSDLGRFQSRNE